MCADLLPSEKNGAEQAVAPGARVPELSPPCVLPNVAETARLPFITTVHDGVVPPHAPPQPAKAKPASAVAVRFTGVPESTVTEQDEGQTVPPALTVPPLGGEMVSVNFGLPTVTCAVAMAPRPSGKVACTVTVNEPALSQWCVVVVPVPVCPSPKDHCASTGPGVSELTVRRVTSVPTSGLPLFTLTCRVCGDGGGGDDGFGSGFGFGFGLGWGFGCGFFPGFFGGVLAGGVFLFGGLPLPAAPPPVPAFVSYLLTAVKPPSSRITPACSLSGSLKKTMPSRVSSWKRVPGESTCGRATTWLACRPPPQTRPLV